MNRYSAIAVFDKDLDRVVLIEKQKPSWQAGKVNFPGGKVEAGDWPGGTIFGLPSHSMSATDIAARDQAHLFCAIREADEETGLVLGVNIDPNTVKHFATLRFTTDGQLGECRFFCCVGDVDAATTREQERIFVDDVFSVMHGWASYFRDPRYRHFLDTMPNLPWLCAMARQRLRDGYDGADVHVVEEVGRAAQGVSK